jgi:uncharacterized protein YuzE
MKVHYHPDTDSLYIHLSENPSVESEEVAPDIVLDFDAQGKVVGIDIDNASKVVNFEKLEFELPNVAKAA